MAHLQMSLVFSERLGLLWSTSHHHLLITLTSPFKVTNIGSWTFNTSFFIQTENANAKIMNYPKPPLHKIWKILFTESQSLTTVFGLKGSSLIFSEQEQTHLPTGLEQVPPLEFQRLTERRQDQPNIFIRKKWQTFNLTCKSLLL